MSYGNIDSHGNFFFTFANHYSRSFSLFLLLIVIFAPLPPSPPPPPLGLNEVSGWFRREVGVGNLLECNPKFYALFERHPKIKEAVSFSRQFYLLTLEEAVDDAATSGSLDVDVVVDGDVYNIIRLRLRLYKDDVDVIRIMMVMIIQVHFQNSSRSSKVALSPTHCQPIHSLGLKVCTSDA